MGLFGAARFDGSGWTRVTGPFAATPNLTAVHGSASDDVWLLDATGDVFHWDGVDVTLVQELGANVFATAIASVGGEVWAAGRFGAVDHFDGEAWRSEPTPLGRRVVALVARSATDVFGVSDGGEVLHSDGESWTIVRPSDGAGLVDVREHGGQLWAVGVGRQVLRHTGLGFRAVNPSTTVAPVLAATALAAPGVAVAIDTNGVLLRSPQGRWRRHAAQVGLFTLAGGDDHAWAFGPTSPVLRIDATGVTPTLSPPAGFLTFGEGCVVDDDEAWVTGISGFPERDGFAWRYDGTLWRDDDTHPVVRGFNGLSITHTWCLGDDGLWAGGTAGLFFRDPVRGWQQLGINALGGRGEVRSAHGDNGLVAFATLGDLDFDGGGLSFFDGVDWRATPLPRHLADEAIIDVAIDGDRIFFAFEDGVHVVEDGAVAEVDLRFPDRAPRIRAFLPSTTGATVVDDSGGVWEGTRGADGALSFPGPRASSSLTQVKVVRRLPTSGGLIAIAGRDVFRFNGENDWVEDPAPSQGGLVVLAALDVVDDDDIWAVGNRGQVAHFDGTTWQELATPDTFHSYTAVKASVAHGVWLGDTDGRVAHVVGDDVVDVPLAGFGRFSLDDIVAIDGDEAGGLWVVTRELGGAVPVVFTVVNDEITRYRTVFQPVLLQRHDGELTAVDGDGSVWTRGPGGWLQTMPPALSSFTFPFVHARLTTDGGFAVGPVPGVHRLGATGFAPVPFRVNPGITSLAVDAVTADADDVVYGVGAAGAILRREAPSP